MGWSQEKVAGVVGMDRTTISKIEEDISNVKIHNAYIPDLRYKIKKWDEDRIFEKSQENVN